MFSFCFSLAAAENDKKLDYLSPELSVQVRANDLVSRMTLEEKVKAGDNVKISVQVKNTGKIAADEVVQLYVKDMEASVPVPIRALQGMKRIHLKPGEEQKVEFMLKPKQFSVVTDDEKYIVEPSVFEIAVGGALPGTNPPTTEVIIKQLQIERDPYHVK